MPVEKVNSKDTDRDLCMTPSYAIQPLLDLITIPDDMLIWEPASGEGHLSDVLTLAGVNHRASSLEHGQDFFDDNSIPKTVGQVGSITNPPYSIKPKWVERCYEVSQDWALLLPVESLAASTLRSQFNSHGGVSVLFFDSRIDFKMPGGKWSTSAAQFPTCWFISGFGIKPNRIFDCSIKAEKSAFKKMHKMLGT